MNIEIELECNSSKHSSIEATMSKDSEKSINLSTKLENRNGDVAISYSFVAEQFQQEQAILSYTPLMYKEEKQEFSFNAEDEYWSSAAVKDTEAEALTTEEAESMVVDVQYATVLHSTGELDHTERRKFAMWVTFNTTYLNLFHSLNALTGDVNYSRTF